MLWIYNSLITQELNANVASRAGKSSRTRKLWEMIYMASIYRTKIISTVCTCKSLVRYGTFSPSTK